MKKTIITVCILFGVSQLFSQDKPIYSVKAGSTYSGWYGSDIDYINGYQQQLLLFLLLGLLLEVQSIL